MMGVQVKSKQRVAEHGEVFTAEREVKAMCDLVADECTRIDSKFLEPACGEGNFLIEILKRKLQTVKSKFQNNFSECERNSLIALSSLYGIDILEDNVKICRENLFNLWDEFYSAIAHDRVSENYPLANKLALSPLPGGARSSRVASIYFAATVKGRWLSKRDGGFFRQPSGYSDSVRNSAKFILEKNIICGDSINGTDKIIFSEWNFLDDKINVQRSDFNFHNMLDDSMFANISLKDFEPIDYRRLRDSEFNF